MTRLPSVSLLREPTGLENEQQQERDQQREQRDGFRQREAEQHVAEDLRRRRRVAQCAGDEAAEDVADADADAGEGDGGKAGANELCGCWIHGSSPSLLSRL